MNHRFNGTIAAVSSSETTVCQHRAGVNAAGNGAALGGVKVSTANSWFAARPSGTEDVQKIYAESFTSPEHLAEVVAAAQQIVTSALS